MSDVPGARMVVLPSLVTSQLPPRSKLLRRQLLAPSPPASRRALTCKRRKSTHLERERSRRCRLDVGATPCTRPRGSRWCRRRRDSPVSGRRRCSLRRDPVERVRAGGQCVANMTYRAGIGRRRRSVDGRTGGKSRGGEDGKSDEASAEHWGWG